VQVEDDIHELGILGWMTFFPQPDEINRDVPRLLLERGARHHIFSAIALGDTDLTDARTSINAGHAKRKSQATGRFNNPSRRSPTCVPDWRS
jgi:hypothetical protein